MYIGYHNTISGSGMFIIESTTGLNFLYWTYMQVPGKLSQLHGKLINVAYIIKHASN